AAVLKNTCRAGFDFPGLVVKDIDWSGSTGTALMRMAPSLLIGSVIAFPLVLVFCGLFMSADLVFKKFVIQIIDVEFFQVFKHCLAIGIGTWIAGGYLRSLLFREPATPDAAALPESTQTRRHFSIGALEINVVLGVLNFLFLAFVIIQFRYMFGGADLVEMTA